MGIVNDCRTCGAFEEHVTPGGSVMRIWTACNWRSEQSRVQRERRVLGQVYSTDKDCWHPVGTIPVVDEVEV